MGVQLLLKESVACEAVRAGCRGASGASVGSGGSIRCGDDVESAGLSKPADSIVSSASVGVFGGKGV